MGISKQTDTTYRMCCQVDGMSQKRNHFTMGKKLGLCHELSFFGKWFE